MSNRPDPVHAEIDHDNDTLTVAITFRWRRPYALDKCEAGGLLGGMRGQLIEWLKREGYAEHQIAGFSYQCWDPNEELQLGYSADYEKVNRSVDVVCSRCGQPAQDIDGLFTWRHITPDGCPDLDNGWGSVVFPNLLDVSFDDPQ